MENQNAISYDYKTVRVKREFETILTDAYQNLGYEVTNVSMAEGTLNSVNVSFKRDRKIKNKIELIKMQDKIDNTLLNIEKLQTKKKNAGVTEGITVGVLGALTFGGGMSISLTLTGIGYLIGGIALGVVGIGIGLLGWFTHNKIKAKKIKEIDPLIEIEFDKLAEYCEKANALTKEEN